MLFLHIGHPKAGSTTLQSFLIENWSYLHASGFAMPQSDFSPATPEAPPQNVLWSLEKMRETRDISPLRAWLKHPENHGRKLILSSENLTHPEWPELFATLKDHVDIRLIYYLRRQDTLFIAAWRQWGLKRGLSLNELIKRRIQNHQPNYASILEAWEKTGMISDCHARFTSPEFLHSGNLVSDFANFLGFDHTKCKDVPDQNTSHDARLLMFLNRHSYLFDGPHDDTLLNLLPSGKSNKVPMTLSRAQFLTVQNAFEANNQEILRKYDPEHAGLEVIKKATAPLHTAQPPTEAEQNRYVQALFDVSDNHNHPKMQALKNAIAKAQEAPSD